MKLPPLNALRAFECAARTNSFAAAGREMGVTSAAVSMQVRNLENWLSRRLFERRNNQIRLTDAGRDYYVNAAAALSDIAQFTQALSQGEARSPLVISATETLCQLWLPERLGMFSSRHPDIPVVVRTGADPVEMERDGIDIRLTYGGELPDYQITPLFTDRLVPVAESAECDLTSVTLIHVDWGPAITSVPGWSRWLSDAGIVRHPDMAATVSVPSVAAAIAQAVAGVGAALVPQSLAAPHIDSGRLVPLSENAIDLPRPFVMISAHYKNRSRRVRNFQQVVADMRSE